MGANVVDYRTLPPQNHQKKSGREGGNYVCVEYVHAFPSHCSLNKIVYTCLPITYIKLDIISNLKTNLEDYISYWQILCHFMHETEASADVGIGVFPPWMYRLTVYAVRIVIALVDYGILGERVGVLQPIPHGY